MRGYAQGLLLTLVLSIVARELVKLPFLSIMGAMVLSILLGMAWNSLMGIPASAAVGVNFASKWLLRTGIVLMGLRLNVQQIVEAGMKVVSIDLFVVLFTFLVVYGVAYLLKVPRDLAVLTGIGTAVCGAAAIVAIAPIIRAREECVAISITIIALVGTVSTIVYTVLYPYLPFNDYVYGVFVGSTLHELAHVIAAGDVGGTTAAETAILVKLGRVALLIPAALIIHIWVQRVEKKECISPLLSESLGRLPIPYFVLGFVASSVVNTLGWINESVTQALIVLSVFLLSMAMVGLGLSVKLNRIKDIGLGGLSACILGTVILAIAGFILIQFLYSS